MTNQEFLHTRRLVRTAVVQDQVQAQLTGSRLVDFLEKGQEVLGRMALGHLPKYFAGSDIEGGVEAGRAVTLVIVGSPFDLPRPVSAAPQTVPVPVNAGGPGATTRRR